MKEDELQCESQSTSDVSKIKNVIKTAREIQRGRFKNEKIFTNSEMNLSLIRKYCQIPLSAKSILQKAINSYNLSARSYFRIIKLSRTIADLENSEGIKTEHILEAIQYRKME